MKQFLKIFDEIISHGGFTSSPVINGDSETKINGELKVSKILLPSLPSQRPIGDGPDKSKTSAKKPSR